MDGPFNGVRSLAEVSFFLSQFTRLTDGQTDNSRMAKIVLHRCSAVKTIKIVLCPTV